MVLVVLPEGGCWQTLSALRKYGGDKSQTDLGGQVGNVAFPGKVMADRETQKLERKDFFQRIVEKVDGRGFLNGPFEET